jgi:F-type H+-transporting ATPase subunit gamma
MAGTLRTIKRRIRSIQSTAKITRAMELVAASKMRRAQLNALAGRPYAEKMRFVLADLAETLHLIDTEARHPLLRQAEEVRNIGIILITPDRGLAGGLPSTINRRTAQFLVDQGKPARTIAVGRKGRDFMRRTGQTVIAEFIGVGDNPTHAELRPISQIAIQEFTEEKVDEVDLIYMQFVNTVIQRPVVFRLLPVEPPKEAETLAIDYIYEPDRETVLAELLPRYIEQQVYAATLEGIASEQSARMVAMRNATENANELMTDLTLVYNKARQESITSELLDIVGGVAALTGK